MTSLASEHCFQDNFSDQPYYSVDQPPIIASDDIQQGDDRASVASHLYFSLFYENMKNRNLSDAPRSRFIIADSLELEELRTINNSDFLSILTFFYIDYLPRSLALIQEPTWFRSHRVIREYELQDETQELENLFSNYTPHTYFSILSEQFKPITVTLLSQKLG